jgi:hypothetical protein
MMHLYLSVIPAKAGIQGGSAPAVTWAPAFAGVTVRFGKDGSDD